MIIVIIEDMQVKEIVKLMKGSMEYMTEERFELKSWHFTKNYGVIYDRLTEKELKLNIYQLIELLNKVSQSEFTLKKLRDEIIDKLDKMIILGN